MLNSASPHQQAQLSIVLPSHVQFHEDPLPELFVNWVDSCNPTVKPVIAIATIETHLEARNRSFLALGPYHNPPSILFDAFLHPRSQLLSAPQMAFANGTSLLVHLLPHLRVDKFGLET